ncbi:prosaposin [Palaemon carinicauda]|uniref:prosaposin n=1 Tax=Palaemon carinicauda TaxID=392227 RepID=UPI0035B61351
MVNGAILVALVAACVLPGECALLGSKTCTYGPSYWCNSLLNAKECGAVKHCIQTVWEKQVLPEDNDDICTICKNMVQEARDQLLSNETQEEIREVFEGSCELIPIRVIAKECKELADDFIPELIDTLASQMNPQVVCATAGLCNSVRIDMLLRDYQLSLPEETNSLLPLSPVKTPGPGDCESCKDFVTRTIRLVKTHSRAELLDRLLAICGQLGSLSDGCAALVESNFDDIYHFLTEQLTPEAFCDLVEMCENRMHQSGMYVQPLLKHTGDEVCDFCEAIVQHWRDVLTSNTTEEEFKQILDGLCHQTGKFSKNCIALVDEYYFEIYNFLMSEVQPKEICEAVGLCGFNSVFKKDYPIWTLLDSIHEVIPPSDILPAVRVNSEGRHMTGMDEAAINEFKDEVELPRVKLSKGGIHIVSAGKTGVIGSPLGKGNVGDDNMCVMCEFAVHFLQNMLEQKSTRTEIEEAVDQLCDMMPHSIAEECEDYVDAYGDQVIELLAQEMDPKQICPILHLCPSEQQLEEASGAYVEKEDVTCVMCEYAMTQLEDILQDHKTEDNIRNALDTLCSYLPKSVKDECQVFVDTYTDQIIHLLINDLSPDEVCVQLGLCKPKKPSLPHLDSSHQLPISRMFLSPQTKKTDDGFETTQSAVCVLCEFAMTQLDEMLSENATEDEIIEVVDYVCAHLPGTLSDDCIGFIEEYGDAIIKLLVHELSPKTVCQQINLCKAPARAGFRAVVDQHLDKCQICKGVVSYVDARLKEGDVTVEIDTILEEACDVFPKVVDDGCRSLVEVYGPYLVNLLAELGDPEQVCQAVKFCSFGDIVQLLGGEKCTWGSSYWCQSQLHASACKMTIHCKTKVWKGTPPLI